MSDDNRIPTETVMSDWAADDRILDAAQVRAQCHRALNGGKPFREEAVSKLLASHEALRAALVTAERRYTDREAVHKRSYSSMWERIATAEAERDERGLRIRAEVGRARKAEARVGVLKAALRELMEAGWTSRRWAAAAAARALLVGEPDDG